MRTIRDIALISASLAIVMGGIVACGDASPPRAQSPQVSVERSPTPTPTPTVMTSQDAAVRDRINEARDAAPDIKYKRNPPCLVWGSAPPGTSEERLAWLREHSTGCFEEDQPDPDDAPNWVFGGGGCRGGEGPYLAILSDGTSFTVYGMNCRDAKAQAKMQAPPGVRITNFFPL